MNALPPIPPLKLASTRLRPPHRRTLSPFVMALLGVAVSGTLWACDRQKSSMQGLPPTKDKADAPALKLGKRSGNEENKSAAGPNRDRGLLSKVGPTGMERYIGTLAPSELVKIPAKQTGTIVDLRVAAGDKVQKGQVLFRQDTTIARLQVQQGEAAINVAQVQASAATRELSRAKQLASGGAAAQVRLDGAKTQSDVARASVAQAQAAVALARQQINDATMRAPISGIVTQKVMSQGELATMMPPSVVVVIESHDPIRAHINVPVAALSRIKAGQHATLEIPELKLSRDAKVTRISDRVDPRTRSAEIIIEAENKDRKLKPGMYVDVTIESTPQPAAEPKKK